VALRGQGDRVGVKKEFGQQLIDWLVGRRTGRRRSPTTIDGERLFYPNANDAGA